LRFERSSELPVRKSPELRRRAQSEDRSFSSVIRAALKAYMEGSRKAR
jgi:hypothetical protein